MTSDAAGGHADRIVSLGDPSQPLPLSQTPAEEYNVEKAGLARQRFLSLLQQLHDEYVALQEQNGTTPQDLAASHLLFSLDGESRTRAINEFDEPLRNNNSSSLSHTPPCCNGNSTSYASVEGRSDVAESQRNGQATLTEQQASGVNDAIPSFKNSDQRSLERMNSRLSHKMSTKRYRDQFQRLDTHGEGALSVETCSDIVKRFTAKRPSQNLMLSTLKYLRGHELDVDDDCELTFEMYMQLMRTPSKGLDDVDAEHQTSLVLLRHALVSEEAIGTIEKPRNLYAHYLDLVPAPVIMINALVMGLRADIAPENVLWSVLDTIFLGFYVLESSMKLWLFGVHAYFCGADKYWNLFDIVCILISVVDLLVETVIPALLNLESAPEIGPLMIIKMLRLARLGRLIRALRYPFFQELKTIVFGVFSGMRVLLWAIVLLVVCIYFFGVTMNGIAATSLEEFKTVPESMFTLFRCFTDGCAAFDGTPLQARLYDMYGAWFMIAYLLIYMFVTFGLFNLIMAIFIDNVVSSAMTRRQTEVAANENSIRSKFEGMLTRFILLSHHVHLPPVERQQLEETLEKDATKAFDLLPGDLAIPQSVFNAWVQTDEFEKLMREADVDISNQLQLFDVLDADMSGQLGLCELLAGLMRLRGSSTKSDMVALTLKVEYLTKLLQLMGGKLGIDAFDIC